MAGIRETFGGNVDFAYGQRSILGRQGDMVGGLERGLASLGKFNQASRQTKDSIKGLNDELRNLQSQRGAAILAGNATQVAKLTKEIDKARKSMKGLREDLNRMPLQAFEKGLGSLTKGLLQFNTSILGMAFDFLISSIKRVYELQEKWTRAIGGFNMQLGGMTRGLQGATKAAVGWSSSMRALTNGDIEEGIKMFSEFTLTLGRVVEKGDEFEKFGLQLARGFNLGAGGAGQLTRVLENIGESGKDASKLFGADLVKAAGAATVPVNLLAKDIQESSNYMARFGKESAKTFVQGAAFARKFSISMKELQGSVEGLDMFDESAKTASKLNTVFGTMINSMDLMMEDNPAKRIEMIRQQFLALGKTEDKMLPTEIRLLSEQLHLTESQTRALLSRKNAGMSYQDFQKKAAATEEEEAKGKRNMELQLRKTVQTMHAFGVSFDKVTVAIGNAIKPLLVVLGLAKDGDKQFTNFNEVMTNATNTVVTFFNSLAKDPKWINFMKELANDLLRAGSALKEFIMDGRAAKFVGDLAETMKKFYTWVRDAGIMAVKVLSPLVPLFLKLAQNVHLVGAAWMGAKALLGASKAAPESLLGKGMGALGGGSIAKGAGKLGMAGLAGGVGAMIGGTGAGIGAGLGSLAGGMFGPMGMILGPIVGGLAGKAISWIFGSSKVKTEIEKAHEELEETIRKEEKRREALTAVLDVVRTKEEAQTRVRDSQNKILYRMEEMALKQKGKAIQLSETEAQMLRDRAVELTKFGKGTTITKEALLGLKEGSTLTSDQLKELITGSQNYETELTKLREVTQKQADLEMAQLEVSKLGQQKNAIEMSAKLHEAELKAAESNLAQTGKVARGDSKMDRFERGATAAQILETFKDPKHVKVFGELTAKERKQLEAEALTDKLKLQVTKDQDKLNKAQSDFLEQQTIIGLRQAVRNDVGFADFQKTEAARGKTIDEQMLEYVKSGQSYLGNDPEMVALMSKKMDFARSAPRQATVTGVPMAANTPSAMNLSPMFSQPPGGFMTSTVADVKLDGQKVGSVVVKSLVTGRN